MTDDKRPAGAAKLIARAQLQTLIDALRTSGHEVIGPVAADGAIVLGPVRSVADLPAGMIDRQEPGRYRLEKSGEALFGAVVGPQNWKRYLYPPRQKLWRAERQASGFRIDEPKDKTPRYAFLGVRGCDLAALAIHDKVFDNGSFTDPGYVARRKAAFVIAVNCTRPGGTCFCASQDTGPRAKAGFDLALTERADGGFLVEIGSDRGAALAAKLGGREASAADLAAADAALAQAAKNMGRTMIAEAREVLARNLDHPHWDEVGKRCLNCANCTMVCPTCFCTTVEDATDLEGDIAERWRIWDSCFTVDFSYIHGGPIRRGATARYRQWITHKLTHWHGQFGTSGCTGCGRCITWCPVGIDITAEARAIRDAEAKQGGA